MVDRGDEQLERAVLRRRVGNAREHGIEERLEVLARIVEGAFRDAGLRIREDDGKVGLLVGRAELDEEVEGFVDDLDRACIPAVDLVDDDNRSEIQLQRLAQHESRLRHHAFRRVDEEQHPLHHLQYALHLSPEVGMSGRVDDVELDVAVADRGVLSEDRDATLALERVRIEHARLDGLPFAKDAALSEHRIDQRCLAMIDVRDDRDIANIRAGSHGACLPAAIARTFIGVLTAIFDSPRKDFVKG